MSQIDIYAPSATGLIWCLAPIVFFALLEGRKIKTRSMYEENYSFLRINIILLATVLPIFTVFLQFYISGEGVSGITAIKNGVIPFIICTSIGIGITYILRPWIKSRLKTFNRKKKIEYSALDNKAKYFSVIFPLYILMLLYIHNIV